MTHKGYKIKKTLFGHEAFNGKRYLIVSGPEYRMYDLIDAMQSTDKNSQREAAGSTVVKKRQSKKLTFKVK